jgi:type I restriction enzyme S subunit
MEIEEWQEVTVEDIKAPFENALATGPFGSSIGSRFFQDQGIPVIRGSNLSQDVATPLNDNGLVFISRDKATEFKRSIVRKGDLIFTCWGTINQVGLIDDRAKYLEYVISNKQMKFTPDPNKADSLFLYYLFSSHKIQDRIKNQSIGSSVPGFNLGQLRAIQFRIPPLNQQKTIAQALSDVDAAIAELDRLITKKRNIKQGTMQQLLAGKKRLPGFSGEWEEKKFCEVTDVITCGLAATPQYVNESVGVPFLSSTNIKNGVIKWNNYKWISKQLHKTLYRNNPPLRGDILYSRVGTIGEAAIIDVNFEFSIYVSLTLIKPKSILHNAFLNQLLNSSLYKERTKNQVYVGGGVGNLNVDVVRQYPIPLPLWEEQKAIAQVLSDMDTEIEALEQKRHKYKAIKQGMMQELLTGRTRLI